MTELLLSGKGSNYSTPNFPAIFSAMQNPRIIAALAAAGIALSMSSCATAATTPASSAAPAVETPESAPVDLDQVPISELIPTPEDVRAVFGDELEDKGNGGDTLDLYLGQPEFINQIAVTYDASQPCVAESLALINIFPTEAYDANYADNSDPAGTEGSFATLRFESEDVAGQYMDALFAQAAACEGFVGPTNLFPGLELHTSAQEGALLTDSVSGASGFYQRGILIVKSYSDVSAERADEMLQLSIDKLDSI